MPVTSVAAARIPLPPHGILGIDMGLSVIWPIVAVHGDPGNAGYQIPVPALASLRGQTLYDQALMMDFGQPQPAWRLTNPVAHRVY
jgi:hypothetical protein